MLAHSEREIALVGMTHAVLSTVAVFLCICCRSDEAEGIEGFGLLMVFWGSVDRVCWDHDPFSFTNACAICKDVVSLGSSHHRRFLELVNGVIFIRELSCLPVVTGWSLELSLIALSNLRILLKDCLVHPPCSSRTCLISSRMVCWYCVCAARSYRACIRLTAIVWMDEKFRYRMRMHSS